MPTDMQSQMGPGGQQNIRMPNPMWDNINAGQQQQQPPQYQRPGGSMMPTGPGGQYLPNDQHLQMNRMAPQQQQQGTPMGNPRLMYQMQNQNGPQGGGQMVPQQHMMAGGGGGGGPQNFQQQQNAAANDLHMRQFISKLKVAKTQEDQRQVINELRQNPVLFNQFLKRRGEAGMQPGGGGQMQPGGQPNQLNQQGMWEGQGRMSGGLMNPQQQQQQQMMMQQQQNQQNSQLYQNQPGQQQRLMNTQGYQRQPNEPGVPQQ